MFSCPLEYTTDMKQVVMIQLRRMFNVACRYDHQAEETGYSFVMKLWSPFIPRRRHVGSEWVT